MLAMALLAATLVLAFANGANDVSKGIATLAGSGIADYRRAVMWGSLCTVAGAVSAAYASQAIVETFSGRGILVHPAISGQFLLAIAAGAIGWLLIATRTGMPVSTTHSIAGALAGAAVIASGVRGVAWPGLLSKIALPLIASPIIAVGLVFIALPLLQPIIGRFERYCVCVEDAGAMAITPNGVALQQAFPAVDLGTRATCSTAVARFSAIDTLHWMAAGFTSFFRGLNDTPKILALGVAGAATLGVSPLSLYALTAVAMGGGSIVAGVRVTRTLAEKVTSIAPANGLVASAITAILVGAASRFALPVSTTHVSSGAIIGVGLSGDRQQVCWTTIREMLLAWVITLPVSAILSAAVLWVMR